MEHFKLTFKDKFSRARTGVLYLNNSETKTPVFMPVGTIGTIKALTSQQIFDLGYSLILANAYHIFQRPGTGLLKKYGGLRQFMAWPGSILTDSGGFQVYSLSRFIRINDEGIRFKSHFDGREFFLTPEDIIEIQEIIGSDIMMPLDECVPYQSSYKAIEESIRRTSLWAKRSKESKKGNSLLFGIIQGGFIESLREKAAFEIKETGFDGYAIGGVSVGEPQELMYGTIDLTERHIPEDRPRYVMGIGLPQDIVFAVSCGIDMFDCVIPTRHARNGYLFTFEGKVLIKNARYRDDTGSIEAECPCIACRHYTRAYLRHLYINKEILYCILGSIHNITFYKRLMDRIRQKIIEGRLNEFYNYIKDLDF